MAVEILDRGACKAMGVVDTSPSVVSASTAGIRRVLSTGFAGRVRLVLEEGIGQGELIAHVTPLPPFLGLGITPAVQWIDDFTVEIQTYDATGTLAVAQVRFSIFRIRLGTPSISPAPPNPQEILGPNLALWLQSDRGVAASIGSPVTTWVNQVPNGNALQAGYADAPVYLANQFDTKPGLAFQTANAGMVVVPTVPSAAGMRPVFWALFRLNHLVHDANSNQTILAAASFTVGFNDLYFIFAEPTGTFDPVESFWDSFIANASAQSDAFLTNAHELSLEPHLFRLSCKQIGQIYVDGRIADGNDATAALAGPLNVIHLSNASIAPFPSPETSNPGFATLGMVIQAFDMPTPEQIDQVTNYMALYGGLI